MRGLLEPASWPCVGAQVKDGSHVVTWMAWEPWIEALPSQRRPQSLSSNVLYISIFTLGSNLE